MQILPLLKIPGIKKLFSQPMRPDLNMKPVIIEDGDNGRLDPGETAPMMITLQNTGHAAIYGVSAELVPLDEEVNVLDNPVQVYGMIGKGASVTRAYTLQAEDSTPNGFMAHFALSVETLPGLQSQDTIELVIGKTPSTRDRHGSEPPFRPGNFFAIERAECA